MKLAQALLLALALLSPHVLPGEGAQELSAGSSSQSSVSSFGAVESRRTRGATSSVQTSSIWDCNAKSEPEKPEAPEKTVPSTQSYQFTKSLSAPADPERNGVVDDYADAFADAFPELKVAASGRDTLLLVGDTGKLRWHYLEVARKAAEELDLPGIQRSYYVGNHLVRLKHANACKIADGLKGQVDSAYEVIGISDKVLVIKPRLASPAEYSIRIEAEAAALKGELLTMDSELEKKATEDEAKLKEKKDKDAEEARRKPRIIDLGDSINAKKVEVALRGHADGYKFVAAGEKKLVVVPPKPPRKKTCARSSSKCDVPPAKSPAKPDTTDNSPEERAPKAEVIKLPEPVAKALAKALGESIPGAKFEAADDSTLIIVTGEWDGEEEKEVKKDEKCAGTGPCATNVAVCVSCAAPAKEEKKPEEKPAAPKQKAQGALVRLYHMRDLTAIVNAFKIDEKTSLVKAIGPDVVLIDPPDKNLETINTVKRILALLDLPRPQIGMQFWSLQVTATTTDAAAESLDKLRHEVNLFNQALQDFMTRAWKEVSKRARDPKALDDDFYRYLTEDFKTCSRDNRYCLGYQDALLKSSPSLTRLVLFLAALNDPANEVAGMMSVTRYPGVEACMDREKKAQNKPPPPQNQDRRESCVCPQGKSEFYPLFCHLEAQLKTLLDTKTLPVLRAAILDFLFHYKWATQYPTEFIPYDLTLSAHVLDSMLTPIHDAFAQDLEEYVEKIRNVPTYQTLAKDQKKRFGKRKFLSSGLLRVTTISGTEAKSEGQVSNYFDVTTPLTLQDLLKENKIFQQGLPGVLTEKEAILAGIAANLLSQPRVIAEVGRGMRLTVKPIALETAASAELGLSLETGEDSPPAVYSGPDDKKGPIDRVTKHTVSDTVRVESFKLFEISTFAMDIEYRKDFILPILGDAWQATFGGVPGMNGLFRWPGRCVQTRSNRSMVIVSAAVAPTAMDLAYSIRFESDRELVPGGTRKFRSAGDLFKDARAYHKLKMRCLRGSKEEFCEGTDKGRTLKMTDLPSDVPLDEKEKEQPNPNKKDPEEKKKSGG